jgi:hypothetical protein
MARKLDDTAKALRDWLEEHQEELERHGCDHLYAELDALAAGQDKSRRA